MSVLSGQVDNDQPQSRSRHLRSDLPTTDYGKRILCQSEKKSLRNRRLPKLLTLSATQQACDKVIAAASILGDERLDVAIQGGDLVAKDVQYHKTCYQNATRHTTLNRIKQVNKAVKMEFSEKAAHEAALESTCAVIDRIVLQRGLVLTLNQICDTYVEHLDREGVHLASYRPDVLKPKLQKRFVNKLLFSQEKSCRGSTLVFADVPKGELVEALVHTAENVESPVLPPVSACSSSTPLQDVYHASLIVRKELLEVENAMSWPPAEDDFTDGFEDAGIIPAVLFNLLVWIITGDRGSGDIPHEGRRIKVDDAAIKRQVLSIAQDILYCARRGHVKTPKHVLLPLAV